VISFLIGTASDTPAIRTFCIFSALAISICYLYQLILFAAVIALSGQREQKGYQSLMCCFKADPQARCVLAEKCGQLHNMIVKWWARSVTQWKMRSVVRIFFLKCRKNKIFLNFDYFQNNSRYCYVRLFLLFLDWTAPASNQY
jgi:hypothetical protein